MISRENEIEYILLHLNKPEELWEPEFQDWLKVKEHRRFFEEVRNYREAFLYHTYGETLDVDVEYRRFRAKTMPQRRLSWVKWAAAVCIIGFCGLAVWMSRESRPLPEWSRTEVPVGKKSAELILANGKRLSLADNQIELRGENSVWIVDDTTSQLAYQPNSIVADSAVTGTTYHTLQVPAGADYVVRLSDGTKVRLNCETNFRFPVAFARQERKVFLDGEGFFEVEKSREWPFMVVTDRMNIQVTGTKFNVKSYRSEEVIHTTLVSGAVNVYTSEKSDSPVVLSPSQQFSMDKRTGKIEVKTVDVSLYTDWTEGWFVFKNQRLEEIMTSLARWYSVEIFYTQASLKELRLSAYLDRYEHIDSLLEIIRATNKVQVERKGKVVTISRK